MSRINLDTEVVPAKFVDQDGGTWQVPSFKVGHAEFTAGAGQRGNAVLFGHVTSINLGNVFLNLKRAQIGDVVEIFGDNVKYVYEVVDVRAVSRTEVSVLNPTEMASVSLITCTGAWLPHLHDYAERLVVRAQLTAAVAG